MQPRLRLTKIELQNGLLLAINQLLNLIIFVLTEGQNRFNWGAKALIQKESCCKLVIQLVKIPHETGYDVH